ncbi:MAG: hypothetical protein CL802_16140 [Citromicrobium sp.]|nr:hypothetical protein [Citromicrobium sp.]
MATRSDDGSYETDGLCNDILHLSDKVRSAFGIGALQHRDYLETAPSRAISDSRSGEDAIHII